ncbi:MAG TPA: cupredoxin domain-containing protein [Actinomycetota bacterium]|nr:cupredoxin domain-containing protein [Actinomycetota bacterium]
MREHLGMRSLHKIVLAILLSTLWACGGEEPAVEPTPEPTPAVEEPTTEEPDAPEEEALSLDMRDSTFQPETLEVPADETVTIELANKGRFPHNFTIVDRDISVTVEPMGSSVVQFETPKSGTLDFYCEFHRGQGMTGKIRVRG